MKVQVICCRRYNSKELLTALNTLRTRGHDFQVASTSNIIESEDGRYPTYRVSTIADGLPVFDGIMLTSGNPIDSTAYHDNQDVLDVVDKYNGVGRPIAAICNMTPVIRNVARGKHVTCYPTIRNKALFEEAGAILENVTMVRDGNLVTGEHPEAADVWAEEFCNLLEGKPQEHFFTPVEFTAGQWERKPLPELEDYKRRMVTE